MQVQVQNIRDFLGVSDDVVQLHHLGFRLVVERLPEFVVLLEVVFSNVLHRIAPGS